MSADTQPIENLMKVSLSIRTDTAGNGETATPSFEFIYGIGPEGVTLFEKALFGKAVGDRIQFNLDAANSCEAVGHLQESLREQTGIVPPASLHVTVTGVVRAPDRDVVKAMAAGGTCGDCGCGCGGH